jgi:hypothetical protein
LIRKTAKGKPISPELYQLIQNTIDPPDEEFEIEED